MQDLRLILIDLHAGFKQTAIQAPPGQLRDEDIRLARKDQLHGAAAPRDAHKVPPNPPRRQKIGDYNLHVRRPPEVAVQGPLDGAASASRTAQQKLLVWRQHYLPGRGFSQAYEALVLEVRALEHVLEGGRQLCGQWAGGPQP